MKCRGDLPGSGALHLRPPLPFKGRVLPARSVHHISTCQGALHGIAHLLRANHTRAMVNTILLQETAWPNRTLPHFRCFWNSPIPGASTPISSSSFFTPFSLPHVSLVFVFPIFFFSLPFFLFPPITPLIPTQRHQNPITASALLAGEDTVNPCGTPSSRG